MDPIASFWIAIGAAIAATVWILAIPRSRDLLLYTLTHPFGASRSGRHAEHASNREEAPPVAAHYR
jgi:hypothetical protein